MVVKRIWFSPYPCDLLWVGFKSFSVSGFFFPFLESHQPKDVTVTGSCTFSYCRFTTATETAWMASRSWIRGSNLAGSKLARSGRKKERKKKKSCNIRYFFSDGPSQVSSPQGCTKAINHVTLLHLRLQFPANRCVCVRKEPFLLPLAGKALITWSASTVPSCSAIYGKKKTLSALTFSGRLSLLTCYSGHRFPEARNLARLQPSLINYISKSRDDDDYFNRYRGSFLLASAQMKQHGFCAPLYGDPKVGRNDTHLCNHRLHLMTP